MPFVPKVKPPVQVEDLFAFEPNGNDAYMVALLENSTTLFLSDGPAPNFPSPWPLWYEPYTIVHEPAVAWLDQRRERLFELRPDLIAGFPHDRGIGGYVTISGLAIGKQPFLEHKIASPGFSWTSNLLNKDRFVFESPIREFIPVSSREEAQSLAPSLSV